MAYDNKNHYPSAKDNKNPAPKVVGGNSGSSEVSTELDDELEYCLKHIKKIKDERSLIEKDSISAIQFYRAEPEIVEVIKGRSKVTTTDMYDAVEGAKPYFLETFAGGDDVVDIQPESEEDVEGVKRLSKLINKQVRRKNKWFQIVNDWISDMLFFKFGGVKVQWYKEETFIDKDYEGLDQMELESRVQQRDVEVLKIDQVIEQEAVIDEMGTMVSPPIASYNLKLRYHISDEYPLIEAVPMEELGFSLIARDFYKTFVYHKVELEPWEFEKKYGKDKKELIDQVIVDLGDARPSTIYVERFAHLGGSSFVFDKEKGKYILYECYFQNPKNGDPWIRVICGDQVLKNDNNPYGRPPFEVATPIRMAHQISGVNFFDLMKDFQKIRTTILRQIIDNLHQANFRRYFGDPTRMNLDDYLNNNTTNALIRVTGDPSTVVMPEVKAPLPPELFTFWELYQMEKDTHSKVPRSFMGTNPKVLNETARGQNQQVQMASQGLQLMARSIAEMGIAPLMRFIADLNMRFLKKKTSIRYMNEWVEVTPDNIICQADFIVNVGLGTNNKDNTIAQMQQLLGIYAQVYQSGIGVVTAKDVYNCMKELILAMGHKNVSDFITDPKQTELLTQFIQTVLMGMQSLGIQDPQMLQMIQQISVAFGLKMPQMPQNGGNGGTLPGQVVPEQAMQPAQPMQPRTTMGGGGFYA